MLKLNRGELRAQENILIYIARKEYFDSFHSLLKSQNKSLWMYMMKAIKTNRKFFTKQYKNGTKRRIQQARSALKASEKTKY